MIDRRQRRRLGWIPALENLPDEQREALLQQAHKATQGHRNIMIVFIVIWFLALLVIVLYLADRSGPHPTVWWAFALVPSPLFARLWRERAAQKVVRERLRLISDEKIESTVATP